MKRDSSRFRETVKICGVVLVTAVAVSLAVPVMVGATGSFVTIQDDAANNNANAQVDGGKLRVGDGAGTISIDGTVTARQGTVPSFRQYYVDFLLNEGCKQLAVPPAGSAVVLTDIWWNVSGAPSQGDLAAISTGTCAAQGVFIATISSATRGGTAMPLGPGVASKTGFIIQRTPGVQIEVTGFGYLTSAAGLP